MLDYKNFHGLHLEIENPAGSRRAGTSGPSKKLWISDMPHNYGYIPNTVGVDGDEIDVFFPAHKFWSSKIYVIHQRKRGKEEYDEDKLMVGFEDKERAIAAYKQSYDKPELTIGPITEWEVDELKDALRNSDGSPGKLDESAKKKYVKSYVDPTPEEEPVPYKKIQKKYKLPDKTAMLRLGLEVLNARRL